ncbi:MAG: GNAT family N-acetyltransferase [Sedimentisphaerales bacterium]
MYSVIDEAEISQELDLSIRHALVECFPADKEAFSRCSWWHSKPSWRILAHTSKNELIGHVAIIKRNVAVGTQRSVVRTAGIQSVFIRPAQRGKGISDRLLMVAMEEAARQNLDSGILFCVPKLEKIYDRTGWRKTDSLVYTLNSRHETVPISQKNITMIHPISNFSFPAGDIYLNGQDW